MNSMLSIGFLGSLALGVKLLSLSVLFTKNAEPYFTGDIPCDYAKVVPATVDKNHLWVNTNKAMYNIGESIQISIGSNITGKASYLIREDRYSPILEEGDLQLNAEKTSNLNFKTEEARFLMIEVMQLGKKVVAGVGIEACQIQSNAYYPEDFDHFWDSLKMVSVNTPLNAKLAPRPDKSSDAQTTYRLLLDNIDGNKVQGWISIPNCGNKFPAIINLPPYGRQRIDPGTTTAEEGAISVSLSIHDFDPEQEVPKTLAYRPERNHHSRHTNYYKTAIIGALRAIDYVYTLADFDKENLAAMGISQGGGLAIMVAGLDERVDLLSASIPALSNHGGYIENKPSGFPYWLRSASIQGTDLRQILLETSYFDASNFAKKFNGISYNSVGYIDETCPPATVFAALNELSGENHILHGTNIGHSSHPDFWSGRKAFFKEHFQLTSYYECKYNPPAPGPEENTEEEGDGFSDKSDSISVEAEQFKIYPNPTTIEDLAINIGLTRDKSVRYEFYTIGGKKIFQSAELKLKTGWHKIELGRTPLRKGIYVARIMLGENVYAKKLIVL